MIQSLSQDAKIYFYDFICEYEQEISKNFGSYNLKDPDLIRFCERNSIHIGSNCETNNCKINRYKFFILWEDRKPSKYSSVKGNDSAHNLLHHLRNAMAHGNIVSENKLRYIISDYSEDKIKRTMKGKMGKSILRELIELVKQTKDKVK